MEELFEQYYGKLVAHLRPQVGIDAEDVAGEVFCRLLERGGLDPERDPWPYLRTIARRIAIDSWRRSGPAAADLEHPSRDPAELVAVADAIRSAFDHLSLGERELLIEHARGRIPGRAARSSTYRSSLSRAKAHLRTLLNDE